MKDFYSKYKGEYSWQIKEEGWVRSLQHIRETQMALGNGFFGSRAVLEEIPYDTRAGTFVAGVFDKIGSQVAELVNLPNPFNFKITIDGEKIDVSTMNVLGHKRILNLRHGLLFRHSIFQDRKHRKYDYQSLRFVSMQNKNIGVMQVIFTPQDEGGKVSIETSIDTSVYNAPAIKEGRKRHFRLKELGQFKNEGYIIVETFQKLHTLIFRSGFYYETRGKKTFAKDNIFDLTIHKNQTVIFTKIFYVDSTSKKDGLEKLKVSSEKRFRKAFGGNFTSLLKRHVEAWEDLWNRAEVSIWGDPETEKTLRFNIYHMLICAPKDRGASSIGAKALTGEGYRGHVFWDTEIFLLPFYLYTLPEVARDMLLYRYNRLSKAKEIASGLGFKGAMFPWESAGTGEEETPAWAKDLDGKVIRIYTGKEEHHITADIAYAFYHYYNVTGDERFLKDYGYELLFEIARFWASRVEYNKRKNAFEIKHVIGPDEFHMDVNNNAFTNMMAKWNLLTAYKMFQRIKKLDTAIYKKISKKLGLSDKEAKAWKKVSSRISININRKYIIEQFDGYFKKRFIRIKEWDENGLPVISEGLTPRDYAKTQFVKQADVVMLISLFSDVFSFKVKKKNYYYYVERTLHRSSLSLPAYAIMAVEVGDRNRAYRFFTTALRTDISNINNNTDDGIHAACIGGTWQVAIFGFSGVRIEKETLSVNPRLPSLWRKVLFTLSFRGSALRFEVTNSKVKVRTVIGGRKRLKIRVFGRMYELAGNKTFIFKRKTLSKQEKVHGAYL